MLDTPLPPLLEFSYNSVLHSWQEYRCQRTLESVYALGYDLSVLKKKTPHRDWRNTCKRLGLSHETARYILAVYQTFHENPTFRSKDRIPVTVLYQLTRLPKSRANQILSQRALNGCPLSQCSEKSVRAYVRALENASPSASPVMRPRPQPTAPQHPPKLSSAWMTRASLHRLITFVARTLEEERVKTQEYIHHVLRMNASDSFKNRVTRSWGNGAITFAQVVRYFQEYVLTELNGDVGMMLFITLPEHVQRFTRFLEERGLPSMAQDQTFQHDLEKYFAFKLLEHLYTVLTTYDREKIQQQYPTLLEETISAQIFTWGAMRETRKLWHEAYERAAKYSIPYRGREIIQDMYSRITRLRQAGVSRLLQFLDKVRGAHATP